MPLFKKRGGPSFNDAHGSCDGGGSGSGIASGTRRQSGGFNNVWSKDGGGGGGDSGWRTQGQPATEVSTPESNAPASRIIRKPQTAPRLHNKGKADPPRGHAGGTANWHFHECLYGGAYVKSIPFLNPHRILTPTLAVTLRSPFSPQPQPSLRVP